MERLSYARNQGEDFKDYFIRLFENKETYGLNCRQIADLLNKENGESWDESTYRKKFKDFSLGREYERNNHSDESLNIQMEELYKEKTKLSDERKDLRRRLRGDARLERRLDIIESKLCEIGEEKFPIIEGSYFDDVLYSMIICFADLHEGACYNNIFGKYNKEISKQRIIDYLHKCLEINNDYKCQNCYVPIMGDLINGNIHKNIQISNEENVIEQVKIATDFVENFLYELSKHFKEVNVVYVPGNHSRMDKKEDALKDERLDDLVIFALKKSLKHIDSIRFIDSKIDSTITSFKVFGKEYFAVHGDFDPYTKAGANTLSSFVGRKPSGIFYAHLHHCTFDDFNGIKAIRTGSFCGSGDEYTVKKRIYGKPSQMVVICNHDGIKGLLPIELN